jgi:mannose PTS system EIIA component
MLGIVIVTHGKIASSFAAALTHIIGPQQQLETIDIEAHDDMDQRRHDILKAIETTDAGSGVVVFTDMFGGTPSNLAITATSRHNVDVIAGVNLPMLVKLASVRASLPLHEAVQQTFEAGRKYIRVASQIVGG